MIQDDEYRAQDDAYTLARAQEIKDDPNRMRAANRKLDELTDQKEEEEEEEAKADRRAKGQKEVVQTQKQPVKPTPSTAPSPPINVAIVGPLTPTAGQGSFWNNTMGK